MPYFVVRRPFPPRPAAPPGRLGLLLHRLAHTVAPWPATTPDDAATVDPRPHASQRQAAHALLHRRRAEPGGDFTVVEAADAAEAYVRAWSPDGAMPPFAIAPVTRWSEMQEALSVRHRVFVQEQGVSEHEEIDEHDLPRAWGMTAIHLVGRLGSRAPLPVATGRLLFDVAPRDLPHIGRVAVLAEFRRHGFGALLMRALEAEARERGFPGVTLSAQVHAMPFYAALGYEAHGPVFLDAGIEHREMEQRWAEGRNQ